MAYAAVKFVDEDVSSEVPTNWLYEDDENDSVCLCWWPRAGTKNIPKYFASLERARKYAENSCSSSTDVEKLGKGQQKKFTPGHHSFSEDAESENETETTNQSVIKLPTWPGTVLNELEQGTHELSDGSSTCTLNPHHELDTVITVIADVHVLPQSPDAITVNEALENSHHEENTVIADIEQTVESQILATVQRIEARMDGMQRSIASLALKVQGVIEVQKIKPITQVSGPVDLIKPLLPLQTVEEIMNFEEILKSEEYKNQYLAFITKIGGTQPKDNTSRALARIFSPECAARCSWRGRGRDNFRIDNKKIIHLLKDVILETHQSTKESEFDMYAAEWFRFGKQRLQRQNAKKI